MLLGVLYNWLILHFYLVPYTLSVIISLVLWSWFLGFDFIREIMTIVIRSLILLKKRHFVATLAYIL